MKRNSETAAPLSTVGLSTVMVIVAVLCMTVFTVLTLATVRAQSATSDAGLASVSAWYEADCAAERTLAELRNGSVPDGVLAEGKDLYLYSCPVSDTQSIEVTARITEENYEILRWQLVYTADWQADDSLEVWTGD